MIENYRFRTCCRPAAGLPYTAIETVCLREGQQWVYTTQENEILYSNYGLICFSSEHSIDTGAMIILPPGCTFSARAATAVSLFVIRIRRDFRLSPCTGIEAVGTVKHSYFQPIDIPQNVSLFFTLLAEEQGWELLTEPFMEVKLLELFTLLKVYYPKEELVKVFFPFFQNDSSFIMNVWKNYDKVKTVRELAWACNCSSSRFQAKFKSAFGMSPYKWMMERRVGELKYEVLSTNKAIGQIAEEHGFSSPSQFSDFFKRNLGQSPDSLRKMNYNHS